MSKLQSSCLILIIALLPIAGCKMDAPIYPAKDTTKTSTTPKTDTGTKPETGTGTETKPDTGTIAADVYTVPIGAQGTIIVKVDNDQPVTINEAICKVTPASMAIGGMPASDGMTSMTASTPESDMGLSLYYNSANTIGEFDGRLFHMEYKNLHLSGDGKCKVTLTSSYFKGRGGASGYFKFTAIDKVDKSVHTLVGSYNIL